MISKDISLDAEGYKSLLVVGITDQGIGVVLASSDPRETGTKLKMKKVDDDSTRQLRLSFNKRE
jgi:hypothetical protein